MSAPETTDRRPQNDLHSQAPSLRLSPPNYRLSSILPCSCPRVLFSAPAYSGIRLPCTVDIRARDTLSLVDGACHTACTRSLQRVKPHADRCLHRYPSAAATHGTIWCPALACAILGSLNDTENSSGAVPTPFSRGFSLSPFNGSRRIDRESWSADHPDTLSRRTQAAFDVCVSFHSFLTGFLLRIVISFFSRRPYSRHLSVH